MSAIKKIALSIIDSVQTSSSAYNLFEKHASQVVPSDKYIETVRELIEHSSSITQCERTVGEIGSLMLDAVNKYIKSMNLMMEWSNSTPRLLAIYLMLLDTSPVKTNEIQRAQLTKKFDDGLSKWKHSQDQIKKTFSATVDIVGKLAAMSVYMQEPTKSMVLNSMAAGGVIGKSFPELSHMFTKLKSSLDACHVQIRNSNENIDELTATTVDYAEELIPDGYSATIDFITDTLKDMATASL